MAKNNNLTGNDVIKQANLKAPDGSEITNFGELQAAIKGNDALANEYLLTIKNVLGRIVIGSYLSSQVPFLKYFWKEDMMYGDYEIIRQTMMGRWGEYDEILDVNDHFKVEVKEQTIWSVFKWVFDLAISTEIVAAAFNSAQSFGTFITAYLSALKHSQNYKWYEQFIMMFQSIPTIYKFKNDGSDGKEITTELMNILGKLTQPSTKFNVEGIPQILNESDIIIVLNSNYFVRTQIDSVAALLNFGDMKFSEKIKGIHFASFTDNETIGAIFTEQSFWLDFRFNKATDQSWAKTLIKDEIKHQWVRGGRIGFAPSIRLVSSKSTLKDGDTQDYKKSPFSHYEGKGDNRVLVKDEPKIRDITSYINQMNNDIIDVPTNVRTFIPLTLKVEGVGDKPTADEILTAIENYDFRFKKSLVNVVAIETSRFAIEVKEPYVISAGRDRLYYDMVYTKKSNGDENFISNNSQNLVEEVEEVVEEEVEEVVKEEKK